MQQVRWYPILAVVALLVPLASNAQGPQPKIREIATFPGANIGGAVYLPNGRIIVYAAGDSLLAYDPATKRSTFISRHFDDELSISRDGDRIAYTHRADDGNDFIWSIPIDPNSGAPTAPAQRVSMSAGDVPSLSPDGKLVAFALWTARGNDLAVVPATGGPERVLASFTRGIGYTAWSADGKWILEAGGRDSIQRFPVAGGRGEKVISYAGRWEGILNEQIAMFRPDLGAPAEGRIAYATSSGMTGAFLIPPGARWTGDYLGVPSQPKLLARTTRPSTAHILNLADGTVRDLLPGALLSRSPVWSPDGRQLALQDSAGGQREITVMNADGTQIRRYPVAWDPRTWGFMQWSSNGQMLAYYAGTGSQSIGVLDLATGNTRIVTSSPVPGGLGFIWRPDGKSIVVVKRNLSVPNPHNALFEARLDGTERMLRDIGAESFGAATGAGTGLAPRAYISDRLVIAGNDSAQFVVPTSGGPPQPLPRGPSPRFWRPGVSPGPAREAKWILWLVQNPGRPITSVDLMTATGDSLRTLNLPFELDPQVFQESSFHPDGRHLILVGKTPGDNRSKIFRVPLNGGTPRVLAQFSGRLIGRFDVSPDGNALAYTVEGAPTSKLYELDLSPILQAIGKQ